MTDKKQDKQELDIAVVSSGTATKASGGSIGFDVGRERGTDNLFLRITSNDGGGTFTKAWQPVAALTDALRVYRQKKEPLRFAAALGPAIPQKGRNNAPFVGYVLTSLDLLEGDPEKPGLYTVTGGWDKWVKETLALPVPPPPAAAGNAEIAPDVASGPSPKGAKGKGGSKGGKKKKKGADDPPSPEPDPEEEPIPDEEELPEAAS